MSDYYPLNLRFQDIP